MRTVQRPGQTTVTRATPELARPSHTSVARHTHTDARPPSNKSLDRGNCRGLYSVGRSVGRRRSTVPQHDPHWPPPPPATRTMQRRTRLPSRTDRNHAPLTAV